MALFPTRSSAFVVTTRQKDKEEEREIERKKKEDSWAESHLQLAKQFMLRYTKERGKRERKWGHGVCCQCYKTFRVQGERERGEGQRSRRARHAWCERFNGLMWHSASSMAATEEAQGDTVGRGGESGAAAAAAALWANWKCSLANNFWQRGNVAA